MAHNLTIRADGKAEFCFTGSRDHIWHKLGSELTENAPIETWVKEAGMDWEIFESAVQYQSMTGQHTFADRRVLFRSDSTAPLSIVGADYKIVQPSEVLEFFRDLTTLHGMKLSAAGTLFGGKRFWATAEIGKQFEASLGDTVNGQLLFVTSADGTTSSQVKLCAERVVCNNTLTVALSEKNKKVVKKSHRSEWDAKAVKIDMGLVDESWETFSDSIKKLAEVEITDRFALDYFQKKFYTPGVLAKDQTSARIKEVSTLMNLYKSGAGANMSTGTAWGITNAVTEAYSHGTGKRNPSHQFWSSEFGQGEKIKNEVLQDMFALMV